MTTLGFWIGPYLDGSLKRLLNRKTSWPDVDIESDVSNIYIRQDTRQRVQVVQLYNSAGHIEAKVCDQRNIIEATFQQDLNTSGEDERKDILKRLRPGSIIELRCIELRITDVFDPYRITLWITDFEVVRKPVTLPVNVTELTNHPRFQNLLTTYFASTTRPTIFSEMRSPEIQSQAGSPFKGSYNSDTENQDPTAISQLQFATQGPAMRRIESSSPTPLAEKRVNTTQDLHALLLPPAKKRRIAEAQPEPTTYGQDRAKPNLAQTAADDDLKRSESGTQRTHGHDIQLAQGVSTSQINCRMEATIPNKYEAGHNLQASATASGEFTERMKTGQPTIEDLGNSHSATTIDEPFSAYQRKLVKGRYLPRRLFRIPPDQAKLLNDHPCWQPPQVGQPPPHGCIPPKLLDRLVRASQQSVGAEQDNHLDKEPDTATGSDVHDVVIHEASQSAVTHTRQSTEFSGNHEAGETAFTYDDLEDEDDSESDEELGPDKWPQSSPTSSRPVRSRPVSSHSEGIASGCFEGTVASPRENTRPMQDPPSTDVSQELQDRTEEHPSYEKSPANANSHPMGSTRLESSQASDQAPECSQSHAKLSVNDPETIFSGQPHGQAIDPSGNDLQDRDLISQIPATFSASSDLPDNEHSCIGKIAEKPTSDTVHSAVLPVVEDEDEGDLEASQQLYSEMEFQRNHDETSCGDGHGESDAERLNEALMPKEISVMGEPRCEDDGKPRGSVRDAKERSMLVARAPHGEEAEVIVPTSSPLRDVRAIMTERGQAARREFFTKPIDAVSPDTNLVSAYSTHQSSRINSGYASSYVRGPQDQTPQTSVLPDPKSNFQKHTPSTELRDKFAAFCNAYPSYNGNIMHFQRACFLIQKLRKDGKAPHVFLWDDFIYRHRREFLNYQLEQAEAGCDTLPYIEYYNEHIESPELSKGIVKVGFIKSLDVGSLQSTPVSASLINNVQARPALRQDLPQYQTLSQNLKHENLSKKRAFDQSIAVSSSASNAAPKDPFQERSSLPSSPPQLQISQAVDKLPGTQTDLVESWLNEASGHQSPVLGSSNNEHGSNDVRMLDVEIEIEESVIGERASHHSSPSPPPALPVSTAVSTIKSEAGNKFAQKHIVTSPPKPWWHDRNTVFKEWARAHERVARQKRRGPSLCKMDDHGIPRPFLKSKIDVASWRKM